LAVRLLRQLAGHGVRRATVVIGHRADRARVILPARLGAMEITLVANPVYAETNTMYSTLLGIDALAEGGYLIEGDIAASDAAIERLAAWSGAGSCWAADAWRRGHSGSRLHTDGTGRILGQDIHRDPTTAASPGRWKSAAMLKLSPIPYLIEGARRLEQAGAGLIAVPCNSVTYFLGPVRAAVVTPILDPVVSTREALRARAPHLQRPLVLGGAVTHQAGLYGAVERPDDVAQAEVLAAIESLKLGRGTPELGRVGGRLRQAQRHRRPVVGQLRRARGASRALDGRGRIYSSMSRPAACQPRIPAGMRATFLQPFATAAEAD
jgi:hypothetical protein